MPGQRRRAPGRPRSRRRPRGGLGRASIALPRHRGHLPAAVLESELGGDQVAHPALLVEALARLGVEHAAEIGRASCRERVCQYVSISVVAVSLNKTLQQYNSRTILYSHRKRNSNYIQ